MARGYERDTLPCGKKRMVHNAVMPLGLDIWFGVVFLINIEDGMPLTNS